MESIPAAVSSISAANATVIRDSNLPRTEGCGDVAVSYRCYQQLDENGAQIVSRIRTCRGRVVKRVVKRVEKTLGVPNQFSRVNTVSTPTFVSERCSPYNYNNNCLFYKIVSYF